MGANHLGNPSFDSSDDINPVSSSHSAKNRIISPLLSKKYARDRNRSASAAFATDSGYLDAIFSGGTACPPRVARFSTRAALMTALSVATK